MVSRPSPETTINNFPDFINDLKCWHASVLFELEGQAA